MASGYYTIRRKKRARRLRVVRHRPKTFSSVEAAEKFAKANNLKNYKLENIRLESSPEKKIRIVEN